MNLWLITMVLLGGLVGGVAVLIRAYRRNADRLATLMGRLDELEAQGGIEPQPFDDGRRDRADLPPSVSGDVLAGRTSYVRRVVDGETPRPVSTGELAIRIVHAALDRSLTPADMASELSISLRTLERALGSEFDCTPRQLIEAMKMREAYRLLNDGRYRVNEVAYRLGYTSPSHFSRRFRTFYHCAPTEVGNRRAG